MKCAVVKTVLGSNPFHFRIEFSGWHSHPECDGNHSKVADVELGLDCDLRRETTTIPDHEHFEYAVAHLVRRLMHSDGSVLYLETSHNAPSYDVDWAALYDCGVRFVSPYTVAHSRVRKNGEREREERERWIRAMEEWERARNDDHGAAGNVEEEDEDEEEQVEDGQEEDSDEEILVNHFDGMYGREEMIELEDISILSSKSGERLAH